jgi:hypothetical protein
MATQRPYADSFAASFAMEAPFMAFLREREANAAWKTGKASALQVMALTEDEYMLPELWEDTMQNTGLLLVTAHEDYPVRSCAVKTLLDRAGVSGSALRKVSKPVLAGILNQCLGVASGDALLRIADHKVSAVHAGDANDYTPLEIPELFRRAAGYLYRSFPACTFAGGAFDHSLTTAVWELTGETGLVKAYRDALALHGLGHTEITPAVRLSSSDVGISGANLYPTLLAGVRGSGVTLGNPLKLEHRAGASLAKFEEQLGMLYAQYTLAIKSLIGLLDIEIRNPVNCLLGVCKRVGVTKKLAYEAAQAFVDHYGDGPCTAHDVYYGINETVFLLQCDGATGSRVVQAEENVARALSMRWGEYDIPGEFKW